MQQPKPVEDLRTVRITVLASPTEYQQIAAAARSAGMAPSTYLRRSALRQPTTTEETHADDQPSNR
jgi:hypothetical protein